MYELICSSVLFSMYLRKFLLKIFLKHKLKFSEVLEVSNISRLIGKSIVHPCSRDYKAILSCGKVDIDFNGSQLDPNSSHPEPSPTHLAF